MIRQEETGFYQHTPRLVIGDFNDIKYPYKKEGGAYRPEYSFNPFRNMLSRCDLHDMKTIGGCFTWVGKRYNHTIRTKIDRAVALGDWFQLYPSAFVHILPWHCSDHRALILNTDAVSWKSQKLFKYDRRWRNEPDFQETIHSLWFDQCQDIPSNQLSKALILCRQGLSNWRSHNITNTQKRIKELKKALQEAYKQQDLDSDIIGMIKANLNHAYRLEEEFWRKGYRQVIIIRNFSMPKLSRDEHTTVFIPSLLFQAKSCSSRRIFISM